MYQRNHSLPVIGIKKLFVNFSTALYLSYWIKKRIILSGLFLLPLVNSFLNAQMGTVSSPYTALGQAQNVTANGVYYFNLTGTTFSTYVLSGGWVQVAFDYGNGIGNLPQGTALTNTARGILSPTVLSKLGSATKVRITSNVNSFAITSSNATHVNRLINNQCLHTGTADNGLQGSWTGSTGSLGSSCNSNSNNGLHQRIYHAACNGNGFHWVPKDNNQSLNLSLGELANSSYLQLWVQAPIVAVINGPTITTQPSASAQNLCLNSSSASLSVAATGTATITYQWYSNASPSNSGGTLISGATTSSYSPPTTVAGTKYYYVVTTNPQGSTTSAVSGAITTSAPSVAGSVSANQTICAGGTPANITITGSTGSIQWQWSTDNVTFTNIGGATSSTLTGGTIGNLTATRYYRAIVTSSPCSAATSTVVTVTVNALATAPTSITGSSSICPGASVTLTAVGGTGTSFQWGTGNTVGNNTISGQTGATITVSPTANTTYWVRRTQTSPCSGNTGGVTFSVSISTVPTATATASNITVCPGVNTTLNVTANQVIAAQDFDNDNTLGYSLSAGSISNGNVGNNGMPANAPHGKNASNGYAVVNNNRTITFNNITGLAGFTSKQIEFNLSALSTNGTNGLDNGDDVIVSVSTDNGVSYSDELEILGNSNATWTYATGTAIATATYDGNDNPTVFAPTTGGQLTTQGYGTIRINLPDNMSQMRFRIEMDNDDNEVWAIDDIRVTGTPTFTYSWSTVDAPTTVLASTQSSIQTTTTNTTYVATVTNAAGCSTTSQVAVTITNPSLDTAPASGNVIWRGATSTDWNTASNWYNFNGTNYTVASAVPTDTIDVIIPANQTCVLAQPSVLSATTNAAKNVTIESGATLTLGGGTLNVAGDWTNNGAFTGSNGTVSFNGSGTATLGGTSSTSFTNLSIDKDGSVSLLVPVTISASLALNNGIIDLGTNNLSVGTATITGGSATSYVKTASTGVLRRNVGSSATSFPVGNSTYNPAIVTNTGTADDFTLRVIDNVTADGTGVGATTSDAVVKRTWMVNEITTGGSNVTLRLHWNGAGEEFNGFNAMDAFIAHYISSANMWDNIGGTVGSDYVEAAGITSFSPFTISSSIAFAPLPIELVSFQANCKEDNTVAVTWTTASEHNTSHYIVEQSRDGQNWSVLGEMAAAGNSTKLLNYEMIDADKATGTTYYRLTQFDNDGVFEVFNAVSVNCEGAAPSTSIMTYPNPSDNSFYVSVYTTGMKGNGQLTITDARGTVVYAESVSIQDGNTVFQIGDLKAAPGMYYIQVSNETTTTDIVKHSLR